MSTTCVVVYVANRDVYRMVFDVPSANRHCSLVAARYNGNIERAMCSRVVSNLILYVKSAYET